MYVNVVYKIMNCDGDERGNQPDSQRSIISELPQLLQRGYAPVSANHAHRSQQER